MSPAFMPNQPISRHLRNLRRAITIDGPAPAIQAWCQCKHAEIHRSRAPPRTVHQIFGIDYHRGAQQETIIRRLRECQLANLAEETQPKRAGIPLAPAPNRRISRNDGANPGPPF
jgi:hypothetical protein